MADLISDLLQTDIRDKHAYHAYSVDLANNGYVGISQWFGKNIVYLLTLYLICQMGTQFSERAENIVGGKK